MLIQTTDSKVLLTPGDMDLKAAQAMIDGGEAVQITTLKINRDVRYSSGDYSASFDAGVVVAVPKECPEVLAKRLLSGQLTERHQATPPCEVVGRTAPRTKKE